MLSLSIVEEIDRLLREGKLSQRKIAARLGVSRGTVGAISNGRRGIHGKEPQADDPHTLIPQGPPERCPRCGFTVYMPCLICRARDYRARRAALQATEGPGNARAPKRRMGRRQPGRTAAGTRRPARCRPVANSLRTGRARVA
jgi:hypothetical protein